VTPYLEVRCIKPLPATVGAPHAAPLLPEGDARAQDLRNGPLALHTAHDSSVESAEFVGLAALKLPTTFCWCVLEFILDLPGFRFKGMADAIEFGCELFDGGDDVRHRCNRLLA